MSCGKMRDVITVLEKDSKVVDTNTTDAYIPVATVRGYVKPTAGKQFYAAAAVCAERLVTVVVRYNPVVRENCRLEFNGLEHRVVSVVDIENRHRYMEIKCEAVVDG